MGYEHFARCGKPLSFVQFLYAAYLCPEGPCTLDTILAPEAVAQQDELLLKFRRAFAGNLPEESFIQQGRMLEVDKLLRYVDIPAHRHSFVECAFVLRGTCNHMVGEYPYVQEQGSCTIIPDGVTHYLVPSPDCVCLTVKVRDAEFNKMDIPNLPYFIYPVSFQGGADPFIRHMVLSLYQQQAQGLPYHERIIGQLFQTLLTYIMQNYRDTLEYLAPRTVQDSQMLEILDYTFENHQTITLQALAEHFHYNPAYLSNLIHKQTGQTFSALLRDFRLKQAARLLTDTKLPLNDLCAAVGYKDPSQFIRNFKALYGTTPLKYRNQNKLS